MISAAAVRRNPERTPPGMAVRGGQGRSRAVDAAVRERRPHAPGGLDEARAAWVVEGEIPEQYRGEALEGEATRVLLAEHAPEGLDWLFISPAAGYGAFAPGERTGSYRVGGEVALFDAAGGSNISGADFALAIVDEIETPRHHREHIGIAY